MQSDRYAAQERMIGRAAQQHLARATAAAVGCGGTGSVMAELLARAGVSLILVDRDIVEAHNLHRQLYEEADIHAPKASALARRLAGVNSAIIVTPIDDDLTAETIARLDHADIVLDGTDNFGTRFLLNDYCRKTGKPFVFSAAVRSEAMAAVFVPNGPCLRCMVPAAQPTASCESVGVLPTASALAAVMAANEALLMLSGEPRRSELIRADCVAGTQERFAIMRRHDCPACAGRYEHLHAPVRAVRELCAGSYQIRHGAPIDCKYLAQTLRGRQDIEILAGDQQVLVLAIDGARMTIFQNGRIIVDAESKRAATIMAGKVIA